LPFFQASGRTGSPEERPKNLVYCRTRGHNNIELNPVFRGMVRSKAGF